MAISVLLCGLNISASAQKKSPDFDVVDSDGVRHMLYDNYLDKGYTVVIKVFFTTCPPCRAIAPRMEPMYQSWGGGDHEVEFFEFSNKTFDTNPVINNYKAVYGITFPSVGQDGEAIAALVPFISGDFGRFFGTPTFIVISPDGDVQFDVEFEDLDDAIRSTGKLKPGDMPVDTTGMPVDTMPTDTTGMPIDTMPTDTTGMPVDTMPGDTIVPAWEFSLQVVSGFNSGIVADIIAVVADEDGQEIYRDTSANGSFSFALPDTIVQHSGAVIFFNKSSLPNNGVTATDLLLIQKHLLGITPFDEQWKVYVSDANLNGSVSAADILYLKRLLLGLEEHFPDGNSWIILHESMLGDEFFHGEAQGVSLLDIWTGSLGSEFIAFKRGDVNGTADPGR